ncbi:GNVR domain-containing protein [Paraburkholderia phymatum]|uniref:GNVR domain-containing protein n=1 Tax=Paraburkholderia phymatum TaxID=148447 RepID=UPI003181FAB2
MSQPIDIRRHQPGYDDGTQFIDQLSWLAENWRLVSAVASIVFALGLAYACFTAPVYRSDAVIQVEGGGPSERERDRERIGRVEEIFNSSGKTTADTEMELMRSRLVISEAVSDLRLYIHVSPRYFPLIGKKWASQDSDDELAAPVLGLSRYAWGGEKITVSRFDVPRAFEGREFVLIARGDELFDLEGPDGKLLGSGRVGQILRVDTAKGPIELQVGTLIATPHCQFKLRRDSTLETINGLQQALFVTEKTKETGVVSLSLDGSDPTQITRVVNALADEYIRQNVQRRSAEARRSLDFLDTQLPILRSDLERAEERYNAFRNQNGTIDLSEEGRQLVKEGADNRAKTIALEQQRAEILQHFTASAPSISTIDKQIALLKQEQFRLAERVAHLPDTEQNVLRLQRDVRVNNELYTSMLNNAQQLRVIEAGQLGSARLVDRAMVPEKPIKPKRGLIITIAVSLGLLAGVVVAKARTLFVEHADRSREIERAAGLPVFAVVPRSTRQKQIQRRARGSNAIERVLALNAPQDEAIESLRGLRVALQGTIDIEVNERNIVMITGLRTGAGKSFLSVNFAAVSAVAGRRVLLIDADMRCGNLHANFGVEQRAGLTDALAGHPVAGLIHQGVMPGVDFLSRGSLYVSPDEMLLRPSAKRTFEELASHYDLVIVDTPPVLAVTDAMLIGKFATVNLLAIRNGAHSDEEIAEINKRLKQAGVELDGILVTDVRRSAKGYATGYSRYYTYSGGSVTDHA